MKLYVIRHAATQMNKEYRINGQLDEPLSDEGNAQLPGIVASVHDATFDNIYSSPLKRAFVTASAIAKDHQCEITTDRRLMEVNAGSLAGQSYDVTIKSFGLNSSELLSTYSYDFTEYGGENSEQVRARVSGFLDDLRATEYNTVLIVTHGGIIRWINYLCTGQKSTSQLNGSVLELTL